MFNGFSYAISRLFPHRTHVTHYMKLTLSRGEEKVFMLYQNIKGDLHENFCLRWGIEKLFDSLNCWKNSKLENVSTEMLPFVSKALCYDLFYAAC